MDGSRSYTNKNNTSNNDPSHFDASKSYAAWTREEKVAARC